MVWFTSGRGLTAAAVALVLVGGCRPEPKGGPKTTPDSAVTGAAKEMPEGSVENAGFSQVAAVTGLSGPESVRYDPAQDLYFVSNFNGTLTAKDNNGFISRVRPDGTIDSLKFVAAGRNGVTLHAPTGMAISGDTLWVADVQVARAFDRRTGAPLGSVSFAGLGAHLLNDVAVDPNGTVYITDTGIRLGANGAILHPGPDRIFRIGPGHRPQVAVQADTLDGPNGIAWDSAAGRFIVLSFEGKGIFAWTPGQKAPAVVATGPGQCDGVEPIGGGRTLVTCWADSSLDLLAGNRLTRVVGNLPHPADIGVDTRRHRVAVPVSARNTVEIWAIPEGG